MPTFFMQMVYFSEQRAQTHEYVCVCVAASVSVHFDNIAQAADLTVGVPNKRLSIFCSQLIFNENILQPTRMKRCAQWTRICILVTLRLDVAIPLARFNHWASSSLVFNYFAIHSPTHTHILQIYVHQTVREYY